MKKSLLGVKLFFHWFLLVLFLSSFPTSFSLSSVSSADLSEEKSEIQELKSDKHSVISFTNNLVLSMLVELQELMISAAMDWCGGVLLIKEILCLLTRLRLSLKSENTEGSADLHEARLFPGAVTGLPGVVPEAGDP